MNKYAQRLKTTEQRFWEKVDITPGCWIWRGSNTGKGYGTFFISGERRAVAHRFSYELNRGKIPQGMTLDHLCRNRACVNPDHLEAVTQRVNVLRGTGPSARRARSATCVRGHNLSPDRHAGPHGHRRCYECGRIRSEKTGYADKCARAGVKIGAFE